MKIKKKTLITSVVIIILILFISILLINKNPNTNTEVTESFATCLGQSSTLYVQEGCGACAVQEQMFKEHYSRLDVVDCIYNRETCIAEGISATPTWVMNNNEKLVGVQQLEKLSEASGCEF